ncbi:MAG TPA: IS4 family transposase [Ktedonobacteraceae bacterium]|nr:IS4 family transposase [Ktedonobacteraceae bacterium]
MIHHTPSTQPCLPNDKKGQPMIAFLQEMLTLSCSHDSRAKRGRGRPATFCLQQLWLGVLIGILQQASSLRQIWRLLTCDALGSFPMLLVTYEGMRDRLLSAGTEPLQALFEEISAHLRERALARPSSALPLAPFASQVVALDETTFDKLKRLTSDLREVAPTDAAHLQPGKLAGLFDLRAQQWIRLQFRADVLAGCNTGILLLLEGLQRGSLILADLGYFAFPWFDYLTQQGYFWISRLKERTTYTIEQVFYQDEANGVLDALIGLGANRSDRTANAVRLVQFPVQGVLHSYLTNVLDPQQLPMLEIAQLYARRWDIELAFKTLKREVGVALWWGANCTMVLVQLWIALILAQLLHALQVEVALQAEVETYDVSMHLLVELLTITPPQPQPLIVYLAERGRFLGLIRPNRRIKIAVPAREPEHICSQFQGEPPPRRARYAQRNGHPRKTVFSSRFTSHFLL